MELNIRDQSKGVKSKGSVDKPSVRGPEKETKKEMVLIKAAATNCQTVSPLNTHSQASSFGVKHG